MYILNIPLIAMNFSFFVIFLIMDVQHKPNSP